MIHLVNEPIASNWLFMMGQWQTNCFLILPIMIWNVSPCMSLGVPCRIVHAQRAHIQSVKSETRCMNLNGLTDTTCTNILLHISDFFCPSKHDYHTLYIPISCILSKRRNSMHYDDPKSNSIESCCSIFKISRWMGAINFLYPNMK